MRTYKFQLKPTKNQEEKLFNTLNMCRFTYNQLLEKLNSQETINRSEVQHEIINIKEKHPVLKEVYSKTLQYECYRLFSNLRGLSQSKKKGLKVGRLRFKGKNWFKTIVYNQSGYKLIQRDNHYNHLRLSKIGNIKLRQHRPIDGEIKSIIIKKKVNTWEAHIVTDAPYTINSGDDVIGIDMGVLSFITDSNGKTIDNPLFMNKSLKQLQFLHQKISRTKKGSKNRRKYCKQLQRKWEYIENQRKDFFHKVSTKLINNSKHIAVENLNIKSMTNNVKNPYYNHRNILDSSWGMFLQMLKFKADSAGIKYVEVNPAYTSKMCNQCGRIKDMPTSIRVYKCSCGMVIDRDYNAAINILQRSLGREPAYVNNNEFLLLEQEATSFRAE